MLVLRRLLCPLGLLTFGVLAGSCSPPPLPLTGSLSYEEGCREVSGVNPPCDSQTHTFSGIDGSGDPPLIVNCTIERRDGSIPRFQFAIAQSTTTVDSGTGVFACGSVPSVGSLATNGHVNLFFEGLASRDNALGSTCDVRILELGTNSVRGQLRCTDAVSEISPPRLHFIRGIPTITTDTEWADFEFSQCNTRSVICN